MMMVPLFSARSSPRIVVSDETEDIDLTMLPINITALDDAVSLVHIPISNPASDADAHSTRIYWTIERACEESQEFFNVTSNRLEVAIFASKELVESEWGEVRGSAGVRLSEGWRVFEISSGEDEDDSSENYDSPHLRYVSAPLAKAGITILYQSSYHADFLLVKEADFERASAIFAGHGWTINPTSNPSPRLVASPSSSGPHTPSTPHTRSSLAGPPIQPSTSRAPASPNTSPPLTANPTGHEITPLPSSLAFVGFHRSSPNFQLHTGLVQKYLTWPGRCRAQYTPLGTGMEAGRPFISYTRTQDGASLVTEVKVIRGMFRGLEEGMLCGDEMGDKWDEGESDLELTFDSESEVSASEGSETETEGCSSTDVDDGDEDADTPRAAESRQNGKPSPPSEYFTFPARPRVLPVPRDIAPTPRRSSSSQRRNRHRKTRSVPTTLGAFELEAGFELDEPLQPRERLKVPQRRSTVGRGPGSRDRLREREKSGGSGSTKVGAEGTEERRKKGRKICIQLDMTGVGSEAEGEGEGDEQSGVYHLDKSGLVTRFSTLLQRANIRMLYSSTFHTANILVEARDVKMARRLLAGAK